MRVVIDGRPLQGASGVRGIGSYARGLLSGFAELATPPDVTLLLSTGAALPEGLPSGVRASAARLAVVHPTLQPIADHLLVARSLRRVDADLYHAIEFGQPFRSRLPVVVTVHDLIPFLFPDDYPWVRRARLPALRLLRRAAAVIAVSQSTARDTEAIAAVDPARIVVIPEGVSPDFRPASAAAVEALRRRHGLTRPFLLAAGAFDPRKRIAALAAVVARVAATRDVDLVITGDQGTFEPMVRATLQRAGITDRTRLLGHVSTEDLVTLYSGSACLVVTSAYEGFGLTPLEAMACAGVAVVFDNSSLPEVAGDAAIVVPDGDVERMAGEILGLLDDPAARALRGAAGRGRAAGLTWARAAQSTLEVYRTVLSR